MLRRAASELPPGALCSRLCGGPGAAGGAAEIITGFLEAFSAPTFALPACRRRVCLSGACRFCWPLPTGGYLSGRPVLLLGPQSVDVCWSPRWGEGVLRGLPLAPRPLAASPRPLSLRARC